MIKGLILGLSLLGWMTSSQPQTATPADSLGWDYRDEDIVAGQVTVFSICLDSAPCVQVKVAEAKSPTVANLYTWKLPPLTVGSHFATVQACNELLCSSTVSLTFNLTITPAAPTNLRPVRGVVE